MSPYFILVQHRSTKILVRHCSHTQPGQLSHPSPLMDLNRPKQAWGIPLSKHPVKTNPHLQITHMHYVYFCRIICQDCKIYMCVIQSSSYIDFNNLHMHVYIYIYIYIYIYTHTVKFCLWLKAPDIVAGCCHPCAGLRPRSMRILYFGRQCDTLKQRLRGEFWFLDLWVLDLTSLEHVEV